MLIIKNFFYLFFLNFLSLFSENDNIVEKNIVQVSNTQANISNQVIKNESYDLSTEETQVVPDDEAEDSDLEELIETGGEFDGPSLTDLNNINLEAELNNLNSDDDELSDVEDEEIEEYEEEIE